MIIIIITITAVSHPTTEEDARADGLQLIPPQVDANVANVGEVLQQAVGQLADAGVGDAQRQVVGVVQT